MTAISLTPVQRSALRGLAHGLPVTVHIGQGGVSEAVLKEVDIALTVHGLLKVRVLLADRDEREAMLAQIADALFCAPVQHIGRILVLWRARAEDAVPAQAAKAGKAPAAAASRGPERAVGRRPAGGRDEAPDRPRRARSEAGQESPRRPRADAGSERFGRPRPEAGTARPGRPRADAGAARPGRAAPGARSGDQDRARRPRGGDDSAAPARVHSTRGPRPADRDSFVVEREVASDRA
ncbi:MAG: YhbY family RNA-binding protein, partial [Pseudomonadota bacterium]|nr:YhbY family RNA-binding protein [Pseudomonadota bacterium]